MLHRQISSRCAELCAVAKSFIVASCNHRQGLTGGSDEKRIGRSPTGDSMASGRRTNRDHLPTSATAAILVPQMVESLCARRGGRLVRVVACAPRVPRPPATLVRASDCQRAPTLGSPRHTRNALSTNWRAHDSVRTESVTGHATSESANHRTGPGAARAHQSTATNRTAAHAKWLSGAHRRRQQPVAPSRSGGARIPEGSAQTLVHLRLQRCLRWRNLCSITPFPQDGRGAWLSDRGLAAPRVARSSSARQCARILWVGTGGTLPVAGDSTVPVPARHPELHSAASAPAQRGVENFNG